MTREVSVAEAHVVSVQEVNVREVNVIAHEWSTSV